MERLTQRYDKYTCMPIDNSNLGKDFCVDKLGKYEDLEEEIGCSLEEAIDVLKTLCKYMSIDTDSADCDDGSYTFEYIDFGGEALQIDNEEDTNKVIDFIRKIGANRVV